MRCRRATNGLGECRSAPQQGTIRGRTGRRRRPSYALCKNQDLTLENSIGLEGDFNFYAYVNGNVLDAVDPSGMAGNKASGSRATRQRYGSPYGQGRNGKEPPKQSPEMATDKEAESLKKKQEDLEPSSPFWEDYVCTRWMCSVEFCGVWRQVIYTDAYPCRPTVAEVMEENCTCLEMRVPASDPTGARNPFRPCR
jgi:hypothetical protein